MIEKKEKEKKETKMARGKKREGKNRLRHYFHSVVLRTLETMTVVEE